MLFSAETSRSTASPPDFGGPVVLTVLLPDQLIVPFRMLGG